LFYRYWKKIASLIVLGIFIILLINSTWFLKLFYPFPHQSLIIKYSSEYKVDPYLVLAIIRTESRFYSKAHSRMGAKGLMQIMPETGEWIAREMKLADYTEEKLFQPHYNIPMGIWYLSYLDKVFKGDLPKLLASYNAGERKVKKWLNEGIWTGKIQDIDQIPYEETRKYVGRVLFDYQVYKRIYNKNIY